MRAKRPRQYPAGVSRSGPRRAAQSARGAPHAQELAAALRRELREELEIDVEVGALLAETVELAHDLTLVALWARIVDGVPRAVEHSRLVWVSVDELEDMAASNQLVPADTAWVPELCEVLRQRD